MCTESVMLSRHLILCRPLLLLPSVFPSIRVFSSESALHIRWPKYWSFSFRIRPLNEYSEFISLKIDWFDKYLLQHHSSKASILWYSGLLYSPTLILVHNYWKNHSFDYMDLCLQSDVSTF